MTATHGNIPAQICIYILITNLLNPKAGAFYLSVLPPFLPPGYPTLPTAALFLAVHLSEGMVWFAFIAAVVGRVRSFLGKPSVQRRLGRVSKSVRRVGDR